MCEVWDFFCSLETFAEDITKLMKCLFIRPETILDLA